MKKNLNVGLVIIICIYVWLYSATNHNETRKKIEIGHTESTNATAPNQTEIGLTERTNATGILCGKSKAIINVTTTLCVHDPNIDFISRMVWKDGIWEEYLIRHWVTFLKSKPTALVFDLGSNIGEFALFGAKLGHKVIAVEPVQDNIERINEASLLEGTRESITIVQNGLYNESQRTFEMSQDLTNKGGQGIGDLYTEKSKKKWSLTTILMDDLIQFIPVGAQEAIMKMDIQGAEPEALQKADKLFSRIRVEVIFFEWYLRSKQSSIEGYQQTIDILKFMRKWQMKPFVASIQIENTNLTALKIEDLGSWPYDIIWLRQKI